MSSPLATRGRTPSRFHHGSHRQLLTEIETVPAHTTAVDGIVVPTFRPPEYLREAVATAAALDCALVVLCSKQASIHRTVALAAEAGIELIAVDVDRLAPGLLPRFRTAELLRGTRFRRPTDTSLKRNLGLLLARALGWERLVFLDDDIRVPRPDDLRDAAKLLDSYAGVGLSVTGYPDNSVVCHAFRHAGGAQATFIGAGALAVGADSFTSFSPDVYNEDWFFLVDNTGLRSAAVTGTAVQRPYDPFLDAGRARAQEFGDCLAEGVFAALDDRRRTPAAEQGYWRDFLTRRRRFIREIIERIGELDQEPAERERIVHALAAAHGRSLLITPQLCVDYLEALRADRETWRAQVERTRTGLRPEKALAELGLLCHARYLQPLRAA
ncbi:hypothetical protein [Amycolatopsis magusensis]|uniref:Glycosyltransferase involved in cell wall biosynthesis n=1 Tax=Amycolatopsis magusensis TaxID=882444 RepID=A0ABS4PQJ5_9PSEU|nr:hypothetical protein [Amycolatopsis magusensis]MBP2181687.1 glycosyltransferase involved in cell wall biosynthesis [Amycolatopsis magusensis]